LGTFLSVETGTFWNTRFAPGRVAATAAGKELAMAEQASIASATVTGEEGVRRRDFINIAAVSVAGVGGLAALYPLIAQMAPSADVLAESST